MEDISTQLYARFSEACRLALDDPNYLTSSSHNYEDDDPLGRPELSVQINNDWSISAIQPMHQIIENHFQNTEEDEDDDDDDDHHNNANENVVENSSINDICTFLSQEESSSDSDKDEEQIVPSSPKKICISTTIDDYDNELSLSDLIELKNRNEEDEEQDGEREQETNNDEKELEDDEKSSKEREKEEESTKKFDVNSGTEILNRSNPQPP